MDARNHDDRIESLTPATIVDALCGPLPDLAELSIGQLTTIFLIREHLLMRVTAALRIAETRRLLAPPISALARDAVSVASLATDTITEHGSPL